MNTTHRSKHCQYTNDRPLHRRTLDSDEANESQYEHRFHYKPLDRSKGAVRLIKIFPLRSDGRIRCRIERHHVGTANYAALSYVWGPDDARSTILLNGQVFRVRPNLYSFLRHIAKHRALTDELFWIDAICINQHDLQERNGHVRHMDMIYRGASRVIAWLENRSDKSLQSQRSHDEWMCCASLKNDEGNKTHHRCNWQVPRNSSWEFVTHKYWNRLWIAQELSLAKKRIDILWKGRFYNWFRLRKHLSISLHRHESSRNEHSTYDGYVQTMNRIRHLPIARYLNRTESEPLGNLVPRFCFHECQVGHDHVFALLSMASDGASFEPDYAESTFSLLLRLLTFSYSHPTVGLTSKIGSSLGISPLESGIAVERLGSPKLLSDLTNIRGFYYRPLDEVSEDELTLCVLIRLPDSNLHFLFRHHSTASTQDVTIYSFMSRIVATSPLVEQAKPKFGLDSKETSPSNSQQSQTLGTLQRIRLCEDTSSNSLQLRCDWSVVVRIFELSRTEAGRGRLESRIRLWNTSQITESPAQVCFVVKD